MISLPSVSCGFQNSIFFIRKNLVLHVDGKNINCYSGSGPSIRDLANINSNGTLSEVSFLSNAGFEMQDVDSSITFNKNFNSSNNECTFFIVLEFPNVSYPLDNGYDILGSTVEPLIAGYDLWFARYSVSANQITINWSITQPDGLGNGLTYNFPTAELPKKICLGLTRTAENSIKILVNGVTQTQATILQNVDFSNTIIAGSRIQTYPGLIFYEYLIYNRGLSDIEILQNYNSLKLKHNL